MRFLNILAGHGPLGYAYNCAVLIAKIRNFVTLLVDLSKRTVQYLFAEVFVAFKKIHYCITSRFFAWKFICPYTNKAFYHLLFMLCSSSEPGHDMQNSRSAT